MSENPKLFHWAGSEVNPFVATDITLRDIFAATIMAGFLPDDERSWENLARCAYDGADALLAARKAKP